MSATSITPLGGDPFTVSPRLRLARLARDAALSVPGVVRMDAGPNGLFAVVSGGITADAFRKQYSRAEVTSVDGDAGPLSSCPITLFPSGKTN